MNIVAIVQARMGSSRLPGKVMCDLAGEPMLGRVIRRLGRSTTLNDIVVATTVEPADNSIEELCCERKWRCFRGSEVDVLDRYHGAAVMSEADVVVRITADCPLIESQIVDKVVHAFLDQQTGVDYVANILPPRTYPRGLDTEVMSFSALDRAWREDKNPVWREHVTPYIYRRPDLFRLHAIVNDIDLSEMRWTVDTQEDLEFVRRVYERLGDDRFTMRDVLALLEKYPELQMINRDIRQKVV